MPQRSTSSGSYRYGFNGKENDNEIKGTGNQQDYGMRIYDPRLGRFLSIDPISKEYPWFTPYQFAGNTPIQAIDLDGAEPLINTGPVIYQHSIPKIKKVTKEFVSGVGNVILGTFGVFTQIFGAAEYGSRVSPDDFERQFPSLANNSIAKDLILPIFIAPLDLSNRLRQEPTNAELWGEAAGILALAKGGTYLGKIKSSEFGLKVDLMGGTNSKYKGYINYDINAKSGIKDGVHNFKNHFGENTIKEMVVDNPQASFLNEVASSITKDGTITIRGQMSNSFFKSIWEGKAEGLQGFEVLSNSKKTGLPNEGYKRTDGTPVGGKNNINEIKLRKK
jgi:RHS repeat-associated protein